MATGVGVSVRTIWKWVRRFREEGATLQDRSSRPARIAHPLPRYQRRQILRSRRKRWSSRPGTCSRWNLESFVILQSFREARQEGDSRVDPRVRDHAIL